MHLNDAGRAHQFLIRCLGGAFGNNRILDIRSFSMLHDAAVLPTCRFIPTQ